MTDVEAHAAVFVSLLAALTDDAARIGMVAHLMREIYAAGREDAASEAAEARANARGAS